MSEPLKIVPLYITYEPNGREPENITRISNGMEADVVMPIMFEGDMNVVFVDSNTGEKFSYVFRATPMLIGKSSATEAEMYFAKRTNEAFRDLDNGVIRDSDAHVPNLMDKR